MNNPNQLVVNLAAIDHNLRQAAQLAPGCRVLAAVKADAYGHGLIPVATSIQQQGSAQLLGVALVEEAQQLRSAGITLPILKFSPAFEDELPAALAANLALTVIEPANVTAASQAAQSGNGEFDVHIKVDTGMRRIGVEPEDVLELARAVVAAPGLNLVGIYTHFPVSDTPAGVDFTHQQLSQFRQIAARLAEEVGSIPFVHAANSGAILAHDVSDTNLVRPGIMIYGSYPDPTTPRTVELAQPLTWTARVLFVKQVKAGETVGYGRTWTAPRDTHIATVGIGYGDGYSRLLSNRGRMLIDGSSYPIVGRVCMDQTMIDLGPDAPSVQAGESAVLIGTSGDQQITVAEIAELMDTIPYEVTCLITNRVPRSYVWQESNEF